MLEGGEKQALIRTAGPADVPLIAELARKIWHSHYPGIISERQIEYMLDLMYDPVKLLAEIQEQKIVYRLLYDGEQPIGYSAAGPGEEPGTFKLHKLYLLPVYHGRGFGWLLLRDVEASAREAAAGRVLLNVNKNNSKAIRSYERNGYRTIDAVMNDIGSGFFMDDYVMEKILGHASAPA